MTPDQFLKNHPQAAAELAKRERDRVLMHQAIGECLDCPALASEAIKRSTSVADQMPAYSEQAAQTQRTSRFDAFCSNNGLMAAAQKATSNAARASSTKGSRDLGDQVAALLTAQRHGCETIEDAIARGVDVYGEKEGAA